MGCHVGLAAHRELGTPGVVTQDVGWLATVTELFRSSSVVLPRLHERLSQFCLGPLSRNRQICSILQRSAARLPVYQIRRGIILGVVASVGAAGSKICLTVLRMVVFRAACCRIFFVNDYSRLLHKKVGMVLFLADL